MTSTMRESRDEDRIFNLVDSLYRNKSVADIKIMQLARSEIIRAGDCLDKISGVMSKLFEVLKINISHTEEMTRDGSVYGKRHLRIL